MQALNDDSCRELEPMLLNEHQAAKFLGGISTKSLYNWRRAGLIPFVRLGGRVLYSLASLRKLIAEWEVGPIDPRE